MATASWYDDDVTSWDTTPAEWTNGSNVTATLEPLIPGIYVHPYWETFRDELENFPEWAYYLMGIYFAVVGILGAIGNIIVIYIFSSTKSLRTPPNMFIINLAVSDLGFSVVNGFPLTTISCFMKRWYYGDMACQIYAFLGGLFGFNSINTLAWISRDRYNVIAKPLQSMYLVTHKRATIKLIFIWLWSLAWALPPLIGWGAYIPEGLLVSCSFDYLTNTPMNISYCYSMFICGFVLPVFMIFYCYINIVRAVAAQAAEMRKTAERMGAKATKADRERKQEIQLTKVAAGTICLFLISWIPYAAVAESSISGYTAWVNPLTTTIPIFFCKASATWNPILYALSHPRFRAALEEKIPCLVMFKSANKPERADSEMDTRASTVERSAPRGAQGRRQKEPEEDSSSMCSEISETTTDDGAQNAKVVAMPDPKKKASPKPARHQPPARPEPPKPQPSQVQTAARSETKILETSLSNNAAVPTSPDKPPAIKRAGSKKIRTSLSKSAEFAFKNLVTAYTSLKRVNDKYGGKAKLPDPEDHQTVTENYAFENPAYSKDSVPTVEQSIPPLPEGHMYVYAVPVDSLPIANLTSAAVTPQQPSTGSQQASEPGKTPPTPANTPNSPNSTSPSKSAQGNAEAAGGAPTSANNAAKTGAPATAKTESQAPKLLSSEAAEPTSAPSEGDSTPNPGQPKVEKSKDMEKPDDKTKYKPGYV